jgi:hypothetical protein
VAWSVLAWSLERPGAGAAAAPVALVGNTAGQVTAVALDGARAYVGSGARLEVLNIQGEPAVTVTATLLPGLIRAIDVAAGRAVVATAAGGLDFLQVDPSAPGPASWRLAAEWQGSGVAAAGQQVIVAAGASGVRLVDAAEPGHPREVGAYDPVWEARAVVVAAGLGYVAAGPDGLRVLDVQQPAAIRELGQLAVPGEVHGLAVADGRAYLAAGAAGLRIVDVADPTAMREVGALAPGWQAEAVAVAGPSVYVAAGAEGLRIVDGRDLARPLEVGSYVQPDCCAHAVDVMGPRAFLAAGPAGLHIVDVADARSPVEVGRIATPAQAVEVADRYAYIATGAHAGMRIYDVINPAEPQLVGGYTVDGFVHDVDLADHFAYLAAGQQGLRVVDVARPAAPDEVGGLKTSKYADYVTVAGRFAYLTVRFAAQDYELMVIDVANPGLPVALSSFVPGFMIAGTAVSDGYAYVVAGDHGLRVLDVRRPRAPLEVGAWVPSSWVSGVVVSGGHAYVATQDGLRVLDLADQAAPVEVGRLDVPGNAQQVAVDGALAYLSTTEQGLHIIDVADPTRPRPIGGWKLAPISPLAVSSGFAYAGDPTAVHVIDVRDPTTPPGRASLATWHAAADIDIAGWTAYVAAEQDGLRLFDIGQLTRPQLLGAFDPSWPVLAVDVTDRRAYVAGGAAGLRVLDVADPRHIAELGGNDTPGVAVDAAIAVQLSGPRAYTGWSWRPTTAAQLGFLRIFGEVSPGTPLEIGALETPGAVQAVAVSGRHVVIGGGGFPFSGGWLKVADATDLQHPVEVGRFDTAAPVTAIALVGALAYLTTADGQLVIVDLGVPALPSELGRLTMPAGAERTTATDVAVVGRFAYVAAGAGGLIQVDVQEPTAPVASAVFDSGGIASALQPAGPELYALADDGGLEVLRFANARDGLDRTIFLPLALDP